MALTRTKAPGGIPRRPKSSGKFLARFFRRYREEHADEPGGVNFADVYKIQGQAWRDLPEAEKAKYEELARQEADKFRAVIKRLQETGRIPGPKPKKNKYVPKHMREETEGDEAPDGSTDMGGGVVKKADGTLIGPDGKPLSAQEAKAFESGYQPRAWTGARRTGRSTSSPRRS